MSGSVGAHVIHVANFYGPRSGGLRTTLHALGAGYRRAGHRFTAVLAGERDTVYDADFGRVYTVRAPPIPGTGGYRMIMRRGRVTALLERLAPDRLEVSDRTTLHGLGAWGRRLGVPTLFFAHERVDGLLRTAYLPDAAARGLADYRNRSTARTFDTVVATTGFAAEEFERVDAPNLARVPLGVDLDRIRPGTVANRAFGPARLLLCSRLSVEKRPELAVLVCAELRRRGIDVRLTVAGDGPRRAALERMAEGLPVNFVGFVSDRDALARMQSAADIGLAPGPIETFGLAALECLAAGTAIVVNTASALPEVLGDDPRAGRPAPGTASGFADAVQQLLEVPPDERAAAARARAEQLPWSATIQRMLELHGLADLSAPAPVDPARTAPASGLAGPSREACEPQCVEPARTPSSVAAGPPREGRGPLHAGSASWAPGS